MFAVSLFGISSRNDLSDLKYLMLALYIVINLQVAPMTLEYSVLWDSYLTQEVVDEMVC